MAKLFLETHELKITLSEQHHPTGWKRWPKVSEPDAGSPCEFGTDWDIPGGEKTSKPLYCMDQILPVLICPWQEHPQQTLPKFPSLLGCSPHSPCSLLGAASSGSELPRPRCCTAS